MKVCVVGSRSLTSADKVLPIIDKFVTELPSSNVTFLIGSAKGVDPLSKHYAHSHGHDVVEFLPYHLLDSSVEFNSKYFFIRTKQMLDNADAVLAIWDTKSKGTHYAIKYTQKLEKPIMIIKVPSGS
jgi:predicted Rossmann fold nucleotide-binding protein DprA/Smf involved in DNA uptake